MVASQVRAGRRDERGFLQDLIRRITVTDDEAVIEYRLTLGGGPTSGGGGALRRGGNLPKDEHPPGLTGGCTLDALAPQERLELPTR